MSLHWILALTLLHCLTAQSKPTERPSKILCGEIKDHINELKTYGCKMNDSTFYSPSGSAECTINALDCSIQELEKVRTECFEENSESIKPLKYTRESIKVLLDWNNITLPNNPNNCFCGQEERLKPYDDFLENILTLLQMLYSDKRVA